MFYIYILENEKGKHYIGYTNDLEDRLKRHNTNQVKWTSNKGPWKIIYSEYFESKPDAYKRERQIKRYKGGNAFKELLRRGGRVVEGVPPEAGERRGAARGGKSVILDIIKEEMLYKVIKERWPSG